jgi:Mrp family chromosome partitioning ATPase
LRYPNIHTYFEHEPELGLEDCLYEGATLSEAAFEPSIDGLAVLAVRRPTFSATQILRSEGLRELLDTIKRDDPDRMIIVDLPSITSSEDARTFNSLVDSILFVVEESATREAHFRKALAMIGKAQLLGTVLNKVGGEL